MMVSDVFYSVKAGIVSAQGTHCVQYYVSASAFYLSHEIKPVKLRSNSTRLFYTILTFRIMYCSH